MSFRPISISSGLSSSLSGVVADPGKYTDPARTDLIERNPVNEGENAPSYSNTNNNNKSQPSSITYASIIIIISALIFVTVISIFDVARNKINNFYAKKALVDPRSGNTSQQIISTLIANTNTWKSSVAFSVFAVISSVILIPMLITLSNCRLIKKT